MSDYVPFAEPTLDEAEVEAVTRVLRSGWVSTGAEADSFEQEFAAYVGTRHAVALNSCTAALHLALLALGVGPGDEVIVPTITFTATAAAVVHTGATPVLADVEPTHLTLDPARVAELIGERTKAVVPVHFSGRMAAPGPLRELCDRHGLALLEDAAHTLPASSGPYRAGQVGDVSAFSFFATKPITTAEGGMLCTDDSRIAEEARVWSLHGLSRGAVNRYRPGARAAYDVDRPGFKYNMSDVQAAMGRVQLAKADRLHAARTAIAGTYLRELGDLPNLELPAADTADDLSSWYLFPVRLRLEEMRADRDAFRDELHRLGVGTSVHFIPLHHFSWYAKHAVRDGQKFPVADAAADRLLSLPIFPGMDDGAVERVVAAVRAAHEDTRS
ncbi:DegT/DnrJ/EryC1/StrS family aminotransferase [Streptomyces sp.]|uniref:DegT/DnrJ/EryC1/StrS family aminotransferase n=1 Tax=Streptomyces sp. TaxID=1931 RepID=UPI002C0CF1C2|nr:DegT/DnrJ/EryC1/StrS family aminotransferase [Streptomyces sp.]HLL34504.1 DegT/DnrJ/EryC1/StrS family aminotransferase [Streptomyces sp.]HZF86895.1 DegT/DnrJ/EryC1/StrS family aminotransferase [Streptomyces sp.]